MGISFQSLSSRVARSHLPGSPVRPGHGRGGSGTSRQGDGADSTNGRGDEGRAEKERATVVFAIRNGDGDEKNETELEGEELDIHSSFSHLFRHRVEDFCFPFRSLVSLRSRPEGREFRNNAAAAHRCPAVRSENDAPLAFSDELVCRFFKNDDDDGQIRHWSIKFADVASPRSPLPLFRAFFGLAPPAGVLRYCLGGI